MRFLSLATAIFAMASSISSAESIAEKLVCQPKRWLFQRDLSIAQIKSILDKTARQDIVRMAWGELRMTEVRNSMAAPLLQYLLGTENRSEVRGYFKFVSQKAFDGSLEDAISIWPKRTKINGPQMEVKDLCKLYQIALEPKNEK